jgi:hypothetical protein
MNKESKPRIPIGEKSLEQTAAPPLLIAWGSPVGHLLKITSSKSKESMLCYTLLLQSETEENMGPSQGTIS